MYHTRLQVICDPEYAEILMAEIAEAGFDSFLETEKGFEAYVETDQYDKKQLAEIQIKYQHVKPLILFEDRIQKQNWNEEWEKNTHPIIIEDQCLIRAEFHNIDKKYPYEIIITPKMSFGTGHHQTTYLMVKSQLQMNHEGKRVMDAGCGTGILAIMASKRGAREIEAFDIDEWSVINGQENIENNQCTNIHLQQGKISDLKFEGKFDIILANINKNVLLAELHAYEGYLQPSGHLLLSGFYTSDIDDLIQAASKFGFKEVRRDEKETWAALLLQKT